MIKTVILLLSIHELWLLLRVQCKKKKAGRKEKMEKQGFGWVEKLRRWRKGLSSDHCGVQKPPFKARGSSGGGGGVGERLRENP